MKAQYLGNTTKLFTYKQWYEITQFTIRQLKVVNDKGSLMIIFDHPPTWRVTIEAHEVHMVPPSYVSCLTTVSAEIWERLRVVPAAPKHEQAEGRMVRQNTTATRLSHRERFEQDRDRAHSELQPPQTKDLKMKIEDVTSIDNTLADLHSVEQFIAMIKKEEQCIKDLDDIGAKSSKLLAMRKEHKANIDRLVELLDAKE